MCHDCARLREERDRLRAYLKHAPECDVTMRRRRRLDNDEWITMPCSCGLDAILSGPAEAGR